MKNKKHISVILVILFVITFAFTIVFWIPVARKASDHPSTRIRYPYFSADPERPLSLIKLIIQPPSSVLCGPASIAMVENYFFGESNSLQYIFDHVSEPNRTGTAAHKVPDYFRNRGLHANLIVFLNLREILLYLEKNQISAIFCISTSAGANTLEGHDIVFTGYDAVNEIISILDPADPLRTSISFNILENYFIRIVHDNVAYGNIIIIATNRINNELESFCKECNYRVTIDGDIFHAIYVVRCNSCGLLIRMFNDDWSRVDSSL
jgi:hypothetical protein